MSKVLQIPFNAGAESLVNKDPMELINFLHNEITYHIDVPDELSTRFQIGQAIDAMNKLTAYCSYFREMEMIARVKKRDAKNAKDKQRMELYLNNEEIFETYKRICEQTYEKITRLMTLKRLNLDEAKMAGKTV